MTDKNLMQDNQNDKQISQNSVARKHLQVLLCSSRDMVIGAGTLIASLLYNSASAVQFTFYIASSKTDSRILKQGLQQRLEKLRKSFDFEYFFIELDDDALFSEIKPRLENLVKKINRNLSEATFYRLIALGMHCYKERYLLYLDTDVLNDGSLEPLLDQIKKAQAEGSKELIMAASDRPDLNDYAVRELGMKGQGYFNSGVMVVDTEQWRQEDLSRKAFEILLARCTNMADQDALNVLAEGRVRWIDRCFDTILHAKNSEEKLKEGTVFYHFTGADKPWKPWLEPDDPKVKLYRSYLKLLEPDESAWWNLGKSSDDGNSALWQPSSIHDCKLVAHLMLKKGRVLSFLRWRLKQIRMKAQRLGFWRTLLGF